MQEEHVTRLSLAVQLVDDLLPTDRPVGEITVALRNQAWMPRVNPSGHRLFLDLPAGSFVVEVRSACYLEEERPVTLPLPDPRNPLLRIVLKPRWPYPFPSGTTLIQGRVQEAGGSAILQARVELVGTGLETRTAGEGRFVLYLRGLTEDEHSTLPLHVGVVAGRRLVEARDGTRAFALRVSHPDYSPGAVPVPELEEGKTFTVADPIVLTRS